MERPFDNESSKVDNRLGGEAASRVRGIGAVKAAEARAREVLAWLRRRGRRKNVEGMARYGITSAKAFGVSMATMRPLVRRLGRDHALAEALWASGWLEARVLAAFVGDPARLTSSQMDRWARDFDNWAVCDSVCFHLFDRSRLAWRKVDQWSGRRAEFVKRAAFAAQGEAAELRASLQALQGQAETAAAEAQRAAQDASAALQAEAEKLRDAEQRAATAAAAAAGARSRRAGWRPS